MNYANYHTHTTFCDGRDTAEDMVLAAIAAGCPELGFSGHSYLPFDDDWNMNPETAAEYRREVNRLRETYKDRISIRLGIEQDICSPTDELDLYEYSIGAVHCLFPDGNYLSVDLSAEGVREGVETLYGGDPYAYAEDFFSQVGSTWERTHCAILAHFDLLTKFLDRDPLLNPDDARYQRAATLALEQIFETPAAIELNTGAMVRGYRTEPYPSAAWLTLIGKAQHPVILSSDAHEKENITFWFDEAMQLVSRYRLNLIARLEDLPAMR